MFLFYFLSKCVAYGGVMFFGARLFGIERHTMPAFVLKWIGFKLVLGLPFGIFMLILFGILKTLGIPEWCAYLVAFGGLRVVEWQCVYRFMAFRHTLKYPQWRLAWVVSGTAVAMASDQLATKFELNSIRYFC